MLFFAIYVVVYRGCSGCRSGSSSNSSVIYIFLFKTDQKTADTVKSEKRGKKENNIHVCMNEKLLRYIYIKYIIKCL